MWFKVDGEALDDWRYARMGQELGVTMGDAFWLACHVWRRLYKRGGGYMSEAEVDGAAKRPGVARAMVVAGLATETPDGLRIRGEERAAEYGSYIASQKAKSAAGVAARVLAKTNEVPRVHPGLNPGLDLSGSGSSPESGSGESSQRAIAAARQVAKREEAKVAAAIWLEWFNRRFLRSFTVTQELAKQVGALLARGYTERPDMRGVALYLRSRWDQDEKMAPHLVPSTILRVTKFPERLDLAKEWAKENPDLYNSLWGSP